MVLLTSTFLDYSLTAPQVRSPPLLEAQNFRNASLLGPSSSIQKTNDEHHVQLRKTPSASSWISFFLAGSSQKPPVKPLLEDVSTMPADGAGAMEISNANTHPDHLKIPSKKGPKGTRRVSFTPQKAQELRQKLKGTDSFHDFMYHSAIASRLASHDS